VFFVFAKWAFRAFFSVADQVQVSSRCQRVVPSPHSIFASENVAETAKTANRKRSQEPPPATDPRSLDLCKAGFSTFVGEGEESRRVVIHCTPTSGHSLPVFFVFAKWAFSAFFRAPNAS
jgi:hypothetical protein